MYELYPYFTNDGSVGLFSPEADDIYHSTYGALSEAYEKFVLPANLDVFFKTNNKIKVLDICYGIGYNSKSFLNFLFEKKYLKILKNKKNKNFFAKILSPHIDTIYINNNQSICNEQIHTNNIICNTFMMQIKIILTDITLRYIPIIQNKIVPMKMLLQKKIL